MHLHFFLLLGDYSVGGKKMPEKEGFSNMLSVQLIIAISSLAYFEGKKKLTRL